VAARRPRTQGNRTRCRPHGHGISGGSRRWEHSVASWVRRSRGGRRCRMPLAV